MKVPRSPGSGKVIAKAKGVRCEAESEGRRRQSSDPTNGNHVKPQVRARQLYKQKPNSCTESLAVNIVGIRACKVAYSRKAYCRCEKHVSVSTAISSKRLTQDGYYSILDRYDSLHLSG